MLAFAPAGSLPAPEQSVHRSDCTRDQDIPWLSLRIRRQDPSELSGGRVASLPRRCTRIRDIGPVVHRHRSDPHVSEPLHPDLMTPAERLDEIAEIVAAGILRARRKLRGEDRRDAGSTGLLARPKHACRPVETKEKEPMTGSVAARVAALPKTPTPELRQMWRRAVRQGGAGIQPQLPGQPVKL